MPTASVGHATRHYIHRRYNLILNQYPKVGHGACSDSSERLLAVTACPSVSFNYFLKIICPCLFLIHTINVTTNQCGSEKMPIYDYHCKKCGHTFEVTMNIMEHERHPQQKCPKCKSREVEQLVGHCSVITSKKT